MLSAIGISFSLSSNSSHFSHVLIPLRPIKKNQIWRKILKDHGLPYPKIPVDVFWLWCQLSPSGGVPQVKRCTWRTFSSTVKHVTWLSMLPSCLTRCKAVFHFVMLSWNPCAVLILYTPRHIALPPKMKFYKTISNFVPFFWIAASMELCFNKMW